MPRPHPAEVIAEWFGVDADFERVPADPPTAYRRDVWLGLALTVLAVGGMELTRSAGYLAQSDDSPAWLLYVLAGAGALPLVVRRRYPLTVLAVVYAHFLLVGLTVPVVPLSQVLQVVYFMTLYTAVAWARDRRAMIIVVAACLAAMFGWLFWQVAVSTGMQQYAEREGLLDDPPGFLSPLDAMIAQTWLTNIAYFLGAIALGQVTWHAARRRAQLAEQAATIERQADELGRRAVVTERLRIARELHDVVAHHVSVIGIQAAAARRLLAKDPGSAAVPLSTIEAASRDAVEQMRGLVGTLRDIGDDGGTAGGGDRSPEPGIADIERLAGADGGLEVTYALVAEPAGAEAAVSGPMGLSLFRTAQEALANVRKHSTARAASVTVRVDRRPAADDARFRGGYAEVEVIDDGRARPGSSGSGLGLVGIRERVATHHGVAEIGPRVTGGYRVRVRLPLPLEES
ncbi:histidine kinase [Isoptericola sp. S6320L]|uniref:sensor histidine kinase n=1 Tax=Isoptericola sp. S6320L TaxID=2926411 RepID=UPI001FF207D5|nr:histidine kinase [Isoptericola sp. S6320L]MCK0117517.1 histidine kinase [Isoptericola sp. S6320L]